MSLSDPRIRVFIPTVISTSRCVFHANRSAVPRSCRSPIPRTGPNLIGMNWNGRSEWSVFPDRHGMECLIGMAWNR